MTIHQLPASDRTVRIGVIDSSFPPVLSIASGDEVELEIWGSWGDAVRPDSTYIDITNLRRQNAGRGPHSLTGPIDVKGASPGMALRVDILDLELRDHGFNLLLPKGESRGLLADSFTTGELRHFRLDTRRMTTELLPGLTLPLRPFLGIMGVAPAAAMPHISSVPGPFGGNIDCPDLVVGATLFLPVWVEGALFYAGDAHAAQGCGEVSQTALETAFRRARLRLTVVENMALQRPRAETAEHLITMGFDPDLHGAAGQAVSDMIDLLRKEYRLSASDGYVLCSLQADLMITQVVNGNSGVHVRMPKAILPHISANK